MILNLLDIIAFIFMAFLIGYDLLFASSAFFYKRKPKVSTNNKQQRFAIIFAAYKEDCVILDSITSFLKQDYPADKYEVVVVSDHMSDETNTQLSELPITLFITDFERSFKHKSLAYALDRLNGFDKVIIMDADNITNPNFLSKVNSVSDGITALQTHRTLKNFDTDIAIWDGISEEVNNSIYRQGRFNLGISSALIGSGMVFDFNWLKQNINQCHTFAEDKELEILLASENIFVQYANNILVYDEKISHKTAYEVQRSRWLHSQHMVFSLIMKSLKIKELNKHFVDKILQWIPIPRILKAIVLFAIIVIFSIIDWHIAIKWYALMGAFILTLLLAIPKHLYTKKTFKCLLRIPEIGVTMLKSYKRSIIRIKNKEQDFQATTHKVKEVENVK